MEQRAKKQKKTKNTKIQLIKELLDSNLVVSLHGVL